MITHDVDCLHKHVKRMKNYAMWQKKTTKKAVNEQQKKWQAKISNDKWQWAIANDSKWDEKNRNEKKQVITNDNEQ